MTRKNFLGLFFRYSFFEFKFFSLGDLCGLWGEGI